MDVTAKAMKAAKLTDVLETQKEMEAELEAAQREAAAHAEAAARAQTARERADRAQRQSAGRGAPGNEKREAEKAEVLALSRKVVNLWTNCVMPVYNPRQIPMSTLCVTTKTVSSFIQLGCFFCNL